MRLVKKLVSGVLAALLFVLGGLAVLVAFADDDLYRWAFHRLLEGTVDREVRVDGGFSLALGLEPNLTITDLRVADASWSERDEMARVDRVEIQIALKPLFSGIVRIPRLLVEGFTLDLERNPDGDGNWNLLKTEGDAAEKTGPKDFFYPLIDHVSLKDIAVTYRDQRSGRDTEIRIARLRKQEIADESGLTLQGDGSLNRTAFQVTGRLGSVAEALAATAPFPIELTLKTLGLTAELAGTAANLPRAEGLDLRLSAQAASLAQVLETWESELLLEGRAELSAHLRGDLEALAAEDIAFRLVETSGQELDATGSLADLLQGRGLDLRVTGKLGPEALHPLGDLPAELRDVIDGIAGFDLSGRISGDLETSAFEDLRADLEHASGATLSLRGQAALGRAEGRLAFTALGVSAEFSAPDPSLLEPLLTTQIPDLGALRATSELSLEDGRVMLSAFTAEAASFGAPRLSAKGRIGSFADGTFALDPQLDLSASLERSRPLAALLVPPPRKAEPPAQVSPPVEKSGKELLLSIQKGLKSAGLDPGPIDGLMGPRTRAAIEAYQAAQGLTVDGRASDGLWRHLQGDSETGPPPVAQAGPSGEGLPELGPAAASGRLSGRDGAYRLDDLRLTLGAKDALWIEATGNLERLRPTAADPLGGLALAVSFTLPSSLSLPWLFPPAVPELRTITGRFDARGSPEALSISKARLEAEGTDDLTWAASGGLSKLSLVPAFAMKGLDFQLTAESPKTESVSRLFGLELPELGPVRARADLRDHDDRFALSGLEVSAGPPDRPLAHLTGGIGDLLALKQMTLNGDFDVGLARLLDPDAAAEDAALGRLQGRFELSDPKGAFGLQALTAEIAGSDLVSLSLEGRYADIARQDELGFQASLTVANLAALGRELGFDLDRLGAFSFTGKVSGGAEKFLAEGNAKLGQTDISGTLSGRLGGARPALSGQLRSPVVHFADFGLRPEPDQTASGADGKKKKKNAVAEQKLFGEDPIPFASLQGFDLDLQLVVDELEGIGLDIDKAEARVDLKDGVLKVDPLRFDFVGGNLVLKLMADAGAKAPKVRLGVTADDLDLGDFLAQLEAEVPLDGEMDMLVDLTAAGATPRALAASLQGEWNLVLGRGHIRTGLLDLAAVDFGHWMFSKSARKGYAKLKCFIARFDFDDGLGKSKVFLIDTTKARALGAGTIDLRNETIDLKFKPQPKKKHLIDVTTPFAIEGPLAKPSIKVSKAGLVARLVGEVILTPEHLLESLLPIVNDHGKDLQHPCLTLEELEQLQ